MKSGWNAMRYAKAANAINRTEKMLYKVSFSPHRDASVIDKKHPRRLAWHQTIKPHPHPHPSADVGLMHSCELLFVFPTSSASAIC